MPQILLIISGVVVLLALVTGIGALRRWWNARPGRYFIRYASQEQKSALSQAQIKFEEHRLRSDNDQGVCFKPKYLDKVLESLNSYQVTIFATKVPRIHELVVRKNMVREAHLTQFTVSGQHVFAESGMIEKLVSDIVIPAVRNNVVIHNSRGQVAEPQDNNALNIFIYSRAIKGETKYLPNRFQGIETEPWDYGYTPTGLGVPLVDNDHVFGELIGNNLYLLVQLHNLQGGRLAQFMRLLEKAAPELDIDKALDNVVQAIPELPRHLNATDRRLAVFDEGFTGRRKVVIRKLVQHILVPAVASHVHIKDGGGRYLPSFDDEMFHVFHGAVPTKGDLPSGRGFLLTDDESGETLGELIGSNLYLYKPLVKYGSTIEAQALARLLLTVRREIMAEADAQAADRTHGELFAQTCLAQAKPYLPGNKVPSDEDLQKAEEGLRVLLAEVRHSEQEVYRLEGQPDTALGAEFDSLLRIAKVRDVTVNETEIIVDTRMMFCRDPRSGLLHRIGEFYIHISTSGGGIRFTNKAGPIELGGGSRMHAPHVNSGGTACLGNTADLFPQLIRNRQFASAVQLGIAFLESVNVNDAWGKSISMFPLAADQTKTKKRKEKTAAVKEEAGTPVEPTAAEPVEDVAVTATEPNADSVPVAEPAPIVEPEPAAPGENQPAEPAPPEAAEPALDTPATPATEPTELETEQTEPGEAQPPEAPTLTRSRRTANRTTGTTRTNRTRGRGPL